MITNEQFWSYWRQGKFEEALQCSLQQQVPEKKGALLFKKANTDTNKLVAISAGEFLFDYLMINPTVVAGLDFARSEDLSSLFQLSTFASGIDTTTLTGDMAQLQGYVAEQMIAQELAMAGHDVAFPDTSNQAGWDLLVDGEPFQVKCGASAQIVEEHFAKYPDIPAYVNSELAAHFEGNPLVLSTTVSREHVLQETTKTVEHAADLTDFEIPWITAAVSAYSQAKRMRQQNLQLTTAVRNVVTDTASRSAMAAVGQAVIGGAGAFILPGAGAIVFPMVGAYVGVTQGGKVAALVKKQLAKKEYNALCAALQHLIERMQAVLSVKQEIKEQKWQTLQQNLPKPITYAFTRYYDDRITALNNVVKELQAIAKTIDTDALTAFERILNALAKSGIHLYALHKELHDVESALKAYQL